MSTTLPYFDPLLDQARRYQYYGLDNRAAKHHERLADFPELPAEIAEETQHRLAQVSAEAERYPRSRRHLAAAIVHGPTKAEYHADMGRVIERDATCADEEALDCFGQATELDPENPRYLCDYGALAIRHSGETERGPRLKLRQAREIAPDDMDTLASYVTGLVDAGQPEEARRVLRDEAFRQSRNRRFHGRYRSLRFKMSHDEQNAMPMEGPRLLPFRRPDSVTHETEDGRIHRHDAAEGHAGPRRQTPDVSRNEQSQREDTRERLMLRLSFRVDRKSPHAKRQAVFRICDSSSRVRWRYLIVSESTMSRLVDFYRGQATDTERRHLEDIWTWDDEELEFVHDYIQWLFPLPDASAFNPDAPILTGDDDIAEFAADPQLRANLAKSFERLLRFFGLTLDASGAVIEADNFASRSADIWEAPNHNWLRMTRILRSLTLLGLSSSALAFFVKLREFRQGTRFRITPDTFLHWKNAVRWPKD